MKKQRIWSIFLLVLLASCQSSRFMQDDMYFTQTDAIREVREFENAWNLARNNKNQVVETNTEEDVQLESNEDYYDYSYTSRLRRFNQEDNTWGYYDPYYTNYYWYNKSKATYFGNSLYSTYNWWGPNFSGNYNSHYWKNESYSTSVKGWTNPWKLKRDGWRSVYNTNLVNGWNNAKLNSGNLWNTGLGYTNMYYNSFDNNCYSWYGRPQHNFSALMQKNGIEKDVSIRPDINYTAIREIKANLDPSDSIPSEVNSVRNSVNTDNKTQIKDDSDVSINSNSRSTSVNTNNNKSTTTTKRWDNHNADLTISPNTNKSNNNKSRSGVFSEGSRNNNYEFKGSAIPNKGSSNNTGTNNKSKDPNK